MKGGCRLASRAWGRGYIVADGLGILVGNAGDRPA